jgi:hypothetical protein
MVERFAQTPSIMTGMVIEHFHGAVTRVPVTATAFPHREPGYNLVIPGVWPDAKDDDAKVAWARDTYDALTPYMAESVYVNYLADDDTSRVQAAYGLHDGVDVGEDLGILGGGSPCGRPTSR